MKYDQSCLIWEVMVLIFHKENWEVLLLIFFKTDVALHMEIGSHGQRSMR